MNLLQVILKLIFGHTYHRVLVRSGHKARPSIKADRWLMCQIAQAPCTIHKAASRR